MKNLWLVFLLAGCASKPFSHTIRIESDPPGARIFFGSGPNEDFARKARQYLGSTPLTWTNAPIKRDGTFELSGAMVYSTFVPPVAVFTAELGGTNRVQMYHGGTIATPADKAPPVIFFDLLRP